MAKGDTGAMGYRDIGHMANETHRGKGVQGVWGTWPKRPTKGMGSGVWGTWAIGHNGYRGYGVQGVWGTGGIGPWAIGTFLPIASLLLDGFLQKINWT